MRAMSAITDQLNAQRGHLFPWSPVFLGTGIGIYFTLPVEPDVVHLAAVAGLSVVLCVVACSRAGFAFLSWAPMLVAAGLCLAAARAHLVAAPVLDFRYYGPVEGRLVSVDRSPTDAVRLTLEDVRLSGVAPARTPARVRISLKTPDRIPEPGARVMTTAHLLPPQGPSEPGGFDFRRHAWFLQLGALGYTRAPILLAEAGTDHLAVAKLRRRVSEFLMRGMDGRAAGFAAAIVVGDRSNVDRQSLENLRRSNLAHLLAISGLHMGLLTGFIFAAIRQTLCLLPWIGPRWPVKKLAAGAALLAGFGYLVLSGGYVATERAFIMVSVMFGAVLLDRRAITLRAVALAAVIVLVRRPESLLSPGFQMSFAATTALVAAFDALRQGAVPLGPGWCRPLVALLISSAVAGAATAPLAAAHFNMVPHYGLLANLLAVPVMGMVVVPAAVLALCLARLGLEIIGLAPMKWGLEWILRVAEQVAALEGAVSQVSAPGGWMLPVFTAGMLVAILWQGRLRLLGVLPAVIALLCWPSAGRPILLIADSGGLVGVMAPEGRALSRAKGQGFTAGIWLENDGDAASQAEAATRWSEKMNGLPVWQRAGLRVRHAPGKRKLASVTDCDDRDIVVTTVEPENSGGADCLVLHPRVMRQTGSIALDAEGRLQTARSLSGARLWTQWQPESAEVRRLREILGAEPR